MIFGACKRLELKLGIPAWITRLVFAGFVLFGSHFWAPIAIYVALSLII